MTEDEAKTKWCPFVRTGLTAGMAVNRHIADAPNANDGVYEETRCIGSGCMMWMWNEKVIIKKVAEITKAERYDARIEGDVAAVKQLCGYCGLVNK